MNYVLLECEDPLRALEFIDMVNAYNRCGPLIFRVRVTGRMEKPCDHVDLIENMP